MPRDQYQLLAIVQAVYIITRFAQYIFQFIIQFLVVLYFIHYPIERINHCVASYNYITVINAFFNQIITT